MATTAADSSDNKPDSGSRRTRRRTTLDDHVDRPSVTEPGDGPFDTTDPLERATSVSPDKAAAARAGFQTVNAAIPLPTPEKPAVDKKADRIERYQREGVDGKLVTVKHNLDTGETEIS